MFLEISPHPVLVRPLRATLAAAGVTDALVTGTLRRDDPEAFPRALATLCAHGHRPPAPPPARILDLPAPPWRGERHWVDPPAAAEPEARPALTTALLGVSWVESPALPPAAEPNAADLVLVAPEAGALPDPAAARRFAADVLAAAGDRRLWIVTRGGAAVTPGEPGRPDLAWVRGLVRTLAFEQPLTRATWLDLDPAEPPEAQDAIIAAERAAGPGDDEIAWRDGRRWVARLTALPTPQRRPGPAVRRGAAYLITGGYGGIGLRVARWLAGSGAGRIVLAGRSGPDPRAAAEIEALRRSGVDVRVVLGDLAEGDTPARLVEAAGDDLTGVVHAAGVLHDGLVAQVSAADLARVWVPKVDGAWRLHTAVADTGAQLDWWLTFSSAAALLGSPGQVAYATANAWLDAFAGWQRAHGVPAAALGWGTWAEVGGATGVRLPGLDPIGADEGIAALAALAGRQPVTAGVLHFDRAAALAAFPKARRLRFFGDVAEPEPQARPAGTLAERLAGHVRNVLGLTEVPGDVPLTDLGLDSLAAIRIKSLVEAELGHALPASVLVRGATLDDVTGAVTRKGVGARDGAERAAVRLFGPVDDIEQRAPEGEAERIAEAARREFGVRVNLLDDPTPRALAVHLRAAEQAAVDAAGPTLSLRATGSGPPLFLLHPAGGSTFVYRGLVDLLGDGFPVHGLERLAEGGPVVERAARYVALIRRIAPDGPYRLGGWSFGGALAFEIARQLVAAGEPVGALALIDAGLPVPMPPERAATLLTERFVGFLHYLRDTYDVPLEVEPARLRELGPDEQVRLVLAEMTRSGVADRLPPAVLRHQIDSHWDTRALDDYRPGPYDGPVTLYRCTRPTPWAVRDPRYDHDDVARGWDRCCTDLRVVPVDGHHLNLLDPPAVTAIAADLRRLL